MASIIIPAYNEEKYIKIVLDKIPDGHEVIVVDDGSTDNTSRVAESYGHMTIILDENSGKGNACKEGVKQSTHEHCIFIDADNQLDPGEIPNIVEALEDADIVIGQRQMKNIPWQRRVSNRFARWCMNYITGENFSDVLCGFRGIRKEKFNELELKRLGYFFECEMLLEAAKKGMKIKTTPVNVDYNTGSRMPVRKSIGVALWLLKNVVKKSMGEY